MTTVLASVSDKTGLVDFLKGLFSVGIIDLRVLATGSTASYLQQNGIACETVDSITEFPEILDGRVKTLHPKVFGGILAKDSANHEAQLGEHSIPRIDMMIVNLYPFETVSKSGAADAEVIENIDIGGVALLRAAAKNYANVVVMPTPAFYPIVLEALSAGSGEVSADTRRELAQKTFAHTTHYDNLIASYLLAEKPTEGMPDTLTMEFSKVEDLRYGENPQQQAAWYQPTEGFTRPFAQLQGKQMSANNLVDAHAAYRILREFPADPATVIIKHNNPCGAAIGKTLEEAYHKAYNADPISAFGGIFGFNETVSAEIAEAATQNFLEILMAPAFTPEALTILAKKKNVRVLEVPSLREPQSQTSSYSMKDMDSFGFLRQENLVGGNTPELRTVSREPLPEGTLRDIAFGWAIVKHLTSNAIVVVKDGCALGYGIGQTSRIASMEHALRQAGEKARGAILASDGFFPATDNIEAAAQAGISVIVQPGGSIKDAEVIEAVDQHGLVMVLTGERCFKH